jgi:uncharacterized membrane protein
VTKRRVEAFSDSGLAIAIALLAIELRPLELEAGQRLAQALWQQWPSVFTMTGNFPRQV